MAGLPQPELGVSDLCLGSRCGLCDIRLAYRALMVVSSHSALTVSVYPAVLSGGEKSPSLRRLDHYGAAATSCSSLGISLCSCHAVPVCQLPVEGGR